MVSCYLSMASPNNRKLKVKCLLLQFMFWNSFLLSGLLHGSVEYANRSHLKVFQGQVDRDTGANKFGAFKLPTIAHFLSPPNPEWNFSPIGKDNQEHFWMHGPVYPCPSNTVSFPSRNIARLGNPNSWCSTLSSYGVHDNVVGSRSLSFPFVSHNSGSQKWRGFELKHANEVPLVALHSGGSSYVLFGVNLENNPPELPSPQVATSVVLENHNYVPLTSQSSVSEPSKSTSGVNSDKQCRNCSSAAIPRAQRYSIVSSFFPSCVLGSRHFELHFRGVASIKA